MRVIAFIILCVASLAASAAAPGVALDKAPIDTTDNASLQRGAKTFVNYCLSCHGASYMRYNRHRDLEFSQAEIKDDLVFTGQKIGDLMLTAMKGKEAKEWFGVLPPDLSVIARSRGSDWLYTYLRSFYRDDTTVSGWNNLVFDRVAMPHVLYEQQGEQRLITDKSGVKRLELKVPGELSTTEFDKLVRDLVNYLVYLGEPAANDRKQLGIIVMIFLLAMLGLAYALKREYWKDIH